MGYLAVLWYQYCYEYWMNWLYFYDEMDWWCLELWYDVDEIWYYYKAAFHRWWYDFDHDVIFEWQMWFWFELMKWSDEDWEDWWDWWHNMSGQDWWNNIAEDVD